MRSFGVAANYDARIHTVDGTFADHGQAGVVLNEYGAPDPGRRLSSSSSSRTCSRRFRFQRRRPTSPAGARSTRTRRDGQWQFVNHATGDIVHSIAITDLEVSGNTATFSGDCRNESLPEGTPCSFRVTVQDNGEGSGAPQDTFSVGGVGFTGAAGPVSGNIQIH